MNKLSPTNIIADLRLGFAVILLGYVLAKLFTDPSFNAEKIGLEVTAIWMLADKLFGSVAARYTADADATNPPLKTDAGKSVLTLFVVAAAAGSLLTLSACGGNTFNGAQFAATAKKIAAYFAKVETPQAVQVETTLATSAALAQVDKANQPDTAQWCSCISRALRQFTGTTVPSADAVKAAITQESGAIDNPNYKILIDSFCSVWAAVVPALEGTHPDAKNGRAIPQRDRRRGGHRFRPISRADFRPIIRPAMLKALLGVVGGGLSGAFSALVNVGVSWWTNRQTQANRPDIIKAKEAQVQQTERDQTAETIGAAMHAKSDPDAAKKALNELRKEASE